VQNLHKLRNQGMQLHRCFFMVCTPCKLSVSADIFQVLLFTFATAPAPIPTLWIAHTAPLLGFCFSFLALSAHTLLLSPHAPLSLLPLVFSLKASLDPAQPASSLAVSAACWSITEPRPIALLSRMPEPAAHCFLQVCHFDHTAGPLESSLPDTLDGPAYSRGGVGW
jgi:hypothetical protein